MYYSSYHTVIPSDFTLHKNFLQLTELNWIKSFKKSKIDKNQIYK